MIKTHWIQENGRNAIWYDHIFGLLIANQDELGTQSAAI